ncbi:TspO/MBR family protein [Fluviicola taffensis]|uniref:TspO and MBR like protein n=1 Tax=Fluviicola taffensis (strain DSM 16823 / NCIMB 13979 / RW262) TaxID=755732 RepID=F2IES7_FLUTR|nr:TspO/MBR family protein [Fluviicola taffensis]AEA45644.1 TspO and MBR like protein [Fluviicola taffensis DSM 16823]
MILRIFLFLVINFAALGIGGYFTGKGVPSEWYASLNKAPWTPPGWVFGAAWTSIMICFAIYMAFAVKIVRNLRVLIILFSLQWVLNVLWNPIFFYFHHVATGLVIITALTILIALFCFRYWSNLKAKSALILPYLIWMIIATSLNAYILWNN